MTRLLVAILLLTVALPAEALTQWNVRHARSGSTVVNVEWRVEPTESASTHQVRFGPYGQPLTSQTTWRRVYGCTARDCEVRVPVTGLVSGAMYASQIVSRDANGNEVAGPVMSMSTALRVNLPGPNQWTALPPIQHSIVIYQFAGDPAHMQFMFHTPQLATTVLDYGTTEAFGLSKSSGKPYGHQHFDLYALKPDTFYWLRPTTTSAVPGVPPQTTVGPVLKYRTLPSPVAALRSLLAWLFLPGAAEAATDPIVTPFDKIPNFAADPTIVSVADGMWDDPATWRPARVPTEDDVALVTHAVTADAPVRVQVLGVEGTVTFAADVAACTILAPGGHVYYERGVRDVTRDCPIHRERDPSAYGTGRLVVNGSFIVAGDVTGPTWMRLAAEPLRGHTTLRLEQPVTWQAGDLLVLPDTRQLRPSQTTRVTTGVQSCTEARIANPPSIGTHRASPEWEEVTIASVSADGKIVTLAAPLRFDHKGGRDPDGGLVVLPHAANLSRSVVFESENPAGTRGHILVTMRSILSVRGALFRDLGRTRASCIESTTFDADGHVTVDPATGQPKYGRNQLGRYALHLHHLYGLRGMVGPQFLVEGSAFVGTRKWALALHDSHFGRIANNVCYHADGACYVTEQGNETANVWEDNIAIRNDGSGVGPESRGRTTGQLGHEGTGFWFRGAHQVLRRNVSANARFAGHMFFGLGGPAPGRQPKFPGADPAILAESTPIRTSFDLIPPEQTDTEGYASTVGGYEQWQGGGQVAPTVEWAGRNFLLWHNTSAGMRLVYTRGLIGTNVKILFDATTLSDPAVQTLGISGHEHIAWQLVDSEIVGARKCLQIKFNRQSLDRVTLRCEQNVEMLLAATGNNNGTPQTLPSWVRLTDVRSLALPGKTARHIETVRVTGTPTPGSAANIVNTGGLKQIVVTRWQRADDSFRVYFREQVPEFILPGSLSMPRKPGEMQQGLSNGENLRQFGLQIHGEMAPCRTTRPGFIGYVCP